MTKKRIFAIFIAVFAVITVACIGWIGEDVKNETIVVNQFPMTGKMEYWTTPGLKMQWFGKKTTYYKTSQLWFGAEDENKEQLGYPFDVTFNDASEDLIYGSLRVKLPTDPTYLARI